MHPMFEEFCRAGQLQHHVLRRMQRQVRDEIQPILDEREKLIEENAALLEEIRQLTAQLRTLEAGKRGPGRPKKVRPEDVAVGA